MGALLALLHMPLPRSARRRGLARQAAANLLAVLETVHLLLAQPALPGSQASASAATERVFPCTPLPSCCLHKRPSVLGPTLTPMA